MALGTALGLALKDATQVFNLLLLLGAGTGLIYILRWFWWRINAQTEIIAMISSLIIACYLTFVHDNMGFLPLEPWMKTVTGAVLTTFVWVISTYLTPPSDDKTLRNFYRLIKPAGPGWNMVIEKAALDNEPIEPISHKDELPLGILLMVIGSVTVYGALFASGNWIYGDFIPAIIFTIVTAIGSYVLFKTWNKIKTE